MAVGLDEVRQIGAEHLALHQPRKHLTTSHKDRPPVPVSTRENVTHPANDYASEQAGKCLSCTDADAYAKQKVIVLERALPALNF